MLYKNPTVPKIMSKDDVRFVGFRSAMDNAVHQLGVGTKVRHTPVITADEEEQMWEFSALNITMPKGVFFICVKKTDKKIEEEFDSLARYVQL